MQKLPGIQCEICAICKEIIFRVDKEHIYIFPNDLLNHANIINFSGLSDSPIYDYLNKEKIIQYYHNIKRRFLFEKHIKDKSIDVLILCHDNNRLDCVDLRRLLKEWIEINVGANVSQQLKTQKLLNGMSPFFVVSTYFNRDITPDYYNTNLPNNFENIIEKRWHNRFYRIFDRELFDSYFYDNWTSEGIPFKNIYLLRCGIPKIFLTDEGNNEYCLNYPTEIYKRIHDSFIESPTVNRFFNHPERSWDAAATPNNDGSKYIIERLIEITHSITRRND